jgi:hypothetical protein
MLDLKQLSENDFLALEKALLALNDAGSTDDPVLREIINSNTNGVIVATMTVGLEAVRRNVEADEAEASYYKTSQKYAEYRGDGLDCALLLDR